MKCNLRFIQLLLNDGADASYQLEDGRTPLYAACSTGKDKCYDLCRLLLEKGADANSRVHSTGSTPLLEALDKQSLEVVKLLLDHGGDIATVDMKGCTALHRAAVNPHVDVLEFVLDRGLDIDCGDGRGFSALFYAASEHNYAGCKILLERGAVNKCGENWWTPLFGVIQLKRYYNNGEKPRMADLLLEHGADVTVNILECATTREINDNVRVVFMRHMAKQKYLNLRINKDLQHIIENKDCYKRYYRACLRELESMQSSVAKVYNNITVFSILMNSNKALSGYARNEELVKAWEGKDFSNIFPIYYDREKTRFYEQVKRQLWLNAAAKILSNLFMFSDPSHPVIQKILQYFTDEDLKFWC